MPGLLLEGCRTVSTDTGTRSTGLTAVMPVYNEIELVEGAVRQLHQFLSGHFDDFEIVVVESGSTDGTAQACDRLERELRNVKVLHEATRNGMGSALRLGYSQASRSHTFLATADIPFPLETLSRAVPLLDRYDCVLSFRDEDRRGMLRKLQSAVYALLVRRSLGLRMKSVNSAFKLIPTQFLRSLPLESRGWFLDAEILYWISRHRLRFAEIPVPLVDRTAGTSKVGLADWMATLSELIAFKRRLNRQSP